MEIIAIARNVRISPRKARVMAAVVKKLPLAQAKDYLETWTKKGTRPIRTVLDSAIANATNNQKLKKEDLMIKNILVDEGLRMKRQDTSHGARFGGGVIQKRTSHIKVILTDEDYPKRVEGSK